MICKRYISEEVKRGHSKNKTITKRNTYNSLRNNVNFADKTSNTYEMPEQQHKKLLHDVTKTHKKTPPKLETSINLEAKNIAELIDLEDVVKKSG